MEKVRAFGYLRVSTRDQADQGHSIAAQEKAILDEVDRRGWSLLEMVRENGSAGRGKHRPELERVLAALDGGDADVLLSTRLDRLSRSSIDFNSMLERAQRKNWNIVLTELGVDFETAVGKMVAGILAQVAEFERDLLSERTKDGMAAAKEKGIAIGRPRELEARTRRRIARERSRGRSYAAIANGLNDDQVERAHGGAAWHASTIRQISLAG